MIRLTAAFLLTLPVAAVIAAAPVAAQYNLPPPGVYEERLPPVMGANDEDGTLPPPGRGRAQRRDADRVLPYPDDEPALPPPTGLFGTPDRAPGAGYGHQLEAQQPPPVIAPPRATNDPDAIRPPGAVCAAPNAAPQSGQAAGTSVMSLPPEDQPETGKPKELPPNLKKAK